MGEWWDNRIKAEARLSRGGYIPPASARFVTVLQPKNGPIYRLFDNDLAIQLSLGRYVSLEMPDTNITVPVKSKDFDDLLTILTWAKEEQGGH